MSNLSKQSNEKDGSKALTEAFQGLKLTGPIPPAFKNKKRSVVKHVGTRIYAVPVTGKKTKAWMEALTASFESQLLTAFQTFAGETWTVAQLRSWTALFVPVDDCWTVLPEQHQTGRLDRENPGFEIFIQKLN